MNFGETVNPVAAIQAILHDYPFSASILRELLQNSDDAGATKQVRSLLTHWVVVFIVHGKDFRPR